MSLTLVRLMVVKAFRFQGKDDSHSISCRGDLGLSKISLALPNLFPPNPSLMGWGGRGDYGQERTMPLAELDQVQPSRPTLDMTQGRLRPVEGRSHCALTDALLLPQLPE